MLRALELRAFVFSMCALFAPGSAHAQGQPCNPDTPGWIPIGYQPIPPRAHHYMAFDRTRSVLVVYGGTTIFEDLTDTWEWDGAAWTRRATQGIDQFSPVYGCYDENLKACVMIGSQSPDGAMRTAVFAWDGGKWSTVSEGGMPGRFYAAVAFDRARMKLVVFGGWAPGAGGDREFASETWEFDGSEWTLVAEGGPPGRQWGRMVYDSARGVCVLHGGSNRIGLNENFLDDTWEWDGVSWREVTTPVRPPNRRYHRMVHHDALGKTILYGGTGLSGSPPMFVLRNDAWEYDGATWAPLQTTSPNYRSGTTIEYVPTLKAALLFGGQQFLTVNSEMWSYASGAVPVFDVQPYPYELADAGGSISIVTWPVGRSLALQWLKNGAPLTDDGRVRGSRSRTLFIDDCGAGDRAEYQLLASDGCSTIVSDPCRLFVGSFCPPDFNNDFLVGNADLGILVGSWGTCPQAGCSGDVNLDRRIDANDLAQLLGSWGFCDF